MDLFKQFVTSQQPLATQDMDKETPTHEVDEEEEEEEEEEMMTGVGQCSEESGASNRKHWISAPTVFDHYEPNTGFGTPLVDTKNGFNELKCYLLLW